MQKICAIALSAALFITPAFAADPPLPPGKPAGVKQAQDEIWATIDLVGIGLAAVGIALLIGGNGKGNSSGSSTTPTAPASGQ